MNKTRNINIVDYIPIGHENGISRKELCRLTGLTDRNVRECISKARETTCICNMIFNLHKNSFLTFILIYLSFISNNPTLSIEQRT